MDKMQHPHLQSPYQARAQPLPSSSSSHNAHGGAFHVRDLQQSLDEATIASSSSNSYGGWANAHASGSSTNGIERLRNDQASPNGRGSPSKAASLANRMQNLSSPPPQHSGQHQPYGHGLDAQAGSSMPPTRGSNPTVTPTSAAPAATTNARSRNPLIDLIETEKGYVDDLGLVIKKVAAAWSRSNFPPPALDKMFRAVEAVYRIDKQFLAKLNDIGPNPSSPKALGDLLMRWIDDLEPAYTKYVNAYQGDFDNYPPVQSNSNLLPILQSLPPLSTTRSHSDDDPSQLHNYPTLDALFSLPLDRLQYYKRLYSKLLRSTQPGKSDHNLLVGANEKLDWLLEMSRESGERRVTDDAENATSVPPPPALSASVPSPPKTGGRSSHEQQGQHQAQQQSTAMPQPAAQHPQSQPSQSPKGHLPHLSIAHSSTSSKTSLQPLSVNTSRPPSEGNVSAASLSSVERSSGQTTASNASTALTSGSLSGGDASVLMDLERRLDTSRTLDIFTMKPKKCKLQMNPPNLPYQRSIRLAGDVQVSLVPASSPQQQEVFTPSAVIYLLTDLFLLCERIPSPANESNRMNPYAEFWLMYPPLATKHLRAHRSQDPTATETAFEIDIMRKERMTVFAKSREKRDEWLEAFQEAINFGGGAGALRVNTDVNRSISPFTAASLSAGGRNTPVSTQTGPSPDGNPSSLPPLPPSASTSYFPSTSPSPHSSRAPTPQEQNAIPMQQRPLPPLQTQDLSAQRVQSPEHLTPMSSGPQQQQQQQQQYRGPGRQGPLPLPSRSQASLGFSPPGPGATQSQSPNMRALPSPMQQSSSQPSLHRPLPNQQNGLQQGHYRNHPQHDSYPSPHQQQQYGQYNENYPPNQYGNMPPPPPRSDGAHKAPSMRSVGSLSSRSSGPASSTTPSPIPPLPMKEQYAEHDWQAAQGATRRLEHGMQQGAGDYNSQPGMGPGEFGTQPDMRNGGLLSPSRSQAGMTASGSNGMIHRSRSAEGLRVDHYRMPSAVLKESLRGQSMPTQGGVRSLPTSRMNSGYVNNEDTDISPPTSPHLEGPVTNQLAAQMKCKVFVQSGKNQWKSLGTAKLKLYLQSPGNRKQLVVEDKTVLISTIVLEDGVERVGKTGVAIELSDNGQRTGLIYMLQMKTEASATGLFQQLLLGSTRASAMVLK